METQIAVLEVDKPSVVHVSRFVSISDFSEFFTIEFPIKANPWSKVVLKHKR